MYLENEFMTDKRMFWDSSTEFDYWLEREKNACTEIEEIDFSKYMDALGVMYPHDWRGNKESESFKLAEMYIGEITYIYAKVENRFFRFRDKVTLQHEVIIKRIREEMFNKDDRNLE